MLHPFYCKSETVLAVAASLPFFAVLRERLVVRKCA